MVYCTKAAYGPSFRDALEDLRQHCITGHRVECIADVYLHCHQLWVGAACTHRMANNLCAAAYAHSELV